ncbi:hypothetical protein ACFVIM_03495 [Streptomyces sp. NPDC057638]|uniref:hypothetical protein n=1 Tax=Streptomyces sp. NPDC057638 TaxID=3346190 RepID=UPI0036778C44
MSGGAGARTGRGFALGWAAGLTSWEAEMGGDVFGGYCPLEQLDELGSSPYPRLRCLDLARMEFDATSYEVLRALADSPVLPGLERLSLRDLVIQRQDGTGEPLAALAELAPRFAHLDLRVAGAIEVEDAGEEEIRRVLPRLRPGAVHSAGAGYDG